MSYNLHVIGRELLQRERGQPLALAAWRRPPRNQKPRPTEAVSMSLENFGGFGNDWSQNRRWSRPRRPPCPAPLQKTRVSGQSLNMTISRTVYGWSSGIYNEFDDPIRRG